MYVYELLLRLYFKMFAMYLKLDVLLLYNENVCKYAMIVLLLVPNCIIDTTFGM